MGSLEDELAGAWEEGEEDVLEESTGDLRESALSSPIRPTQSRDGPNHTGDLAHDVATSPTLTTKSTSPRKQRKQGHTRTESRYDGSDYGELSEDEMIPPGPDLKPELRMLLRDVEELAAQGTLTFLPPQARPSLDQPNGDHKHRRKESLPKVEPDAHISTLLTRLRDLGQQATLETQTSRLITAHTSLTSHMTHQSRAIQTAAYPLLSPLNNLGTVADPADLDTVLALLEQTLETLPQPSFTSLNSLSHLATAGREAITTLNALSDSLHMSRQAEAAAARRLKSVREQVAELRREFELEEMGRRWLEEGEWEERLKRRDAKRICGEVTGGFEEVCETWRRRLVSGLEVSA